MELVLQSRFVRLSELVLPELRAIPSSDRAVALRRAAGIAFDPVELVALAAGLVLVAWLTRYGVGTMGPLGRLAQGAVHVAFALPLMAIVVAPIQWRRTRRGLRKAIAGAGRWPARDP
jgi:hypothetical protein